MSDLRYLHARNPRNTQRTDSRVQCCSTWPNQLVVHVALQQRHVEGNRRVEFGYDPNESRVGAEQMGGFQRSAFTLSRNGTWDEFRYELVETEHPILFQSSRPVILEREQRAAELFQNEGERSTILIRISP